MSLSSEHHSTDNKNAAKGTEVFVGGLPRSISEDKIKEVFSACGEIAEVRMIKDQKGNYKGFCFVRFATKEAAARAVSEKSGTLLDGREIGVLPSIEQDTLYFGNLNKAWSEDEFEKLVLQVFPDIESVDLVTLKDSPLGQKQRNRGFAFVKFSSHAAAARAHRVGSQPEFRLGNLHPTVQWAEEEPEFDPKELAKIKIAFIRNLPADADESYLKQLFEPFGRVEKVVVSKKGSYPVGFVHFTERSDLEKAIKEMNDKTVQGPRGGPTHKLQVEAARPMGKNKKRVRDNSESNSSAQIHSKLLKAELNVAPPDNHNSHIQRELVSVDPYEDAVIALPLAVKERLLRILRLGIATRFDIDVKILHSLMGLPESIAISVLDQFLLSGASLRNKGAYLSALISNHLVDKVVSAKRLVSPSNFVDTTRKESKIFGFPDGVSPPAVGSFASHAHPTASRPEVYAPHYASAQMDYPLSSRTQVERERAEERVPEFLLPSRLLSGPQSIPVPRGVNLEERSHSPADAAPGYSIPYGRVGIRTEERHHLGPVHSAPSSSASYARHGSSLSYDPSWKERETGTELIMPTSADRQAPRPQVRFDPFTGEPYKFDPFTGEPIRPA